MKRLATIVFTLSSLASVPTVLAHPRACGGRGFGHVGFAGHGCGVSRGWFRGSCGSHYWGRSCYRPCYRSWGIGVGYSPGYYYGGYSSAPVYYEGPAVAERPGPPPEITEWADEDLRHMALDKFCGTRGLDPTENRIAIELVNKEYHDDTGALIKAKFKVRWVVWKICYQRDGSEVREEKQKSTGVKLKFDDLGRFTEYCD